MDNLNLIDTFSEFKDLKNIDRATMMSVLEDAFRSVIQKHIRSKRDTRLEKCYSKTIRHGREF